MRLCNVTIMIVMLSAGAGAALGQEGDPARGLAFAARVCAECHAIENSLLESPLPLAPSLKVIANSPGMSAIALNVVLSTPHEIMPNLVLSRQETADVIEYILSLKDD